MNSQNNDVAGAGKASNGWSVWLHCLIAAIVSTAIFFALMTAVNVLYVCAWFAFWVSVIVEGFNNANSN